MYKRQIMAKNVTERNEALDKLLPMQRGDFDGLFRAMDGLSLIHISEPTRPY